MIFITLLLVLYSLVTFTDFSIEQIEEVYSCNTIPASLLSKLLMENLKSRAINNSSNIFLINSNNNNDTACTSNQVDDESFEDAPTITERDIRAAANTDGKTCEYD